MEQEEARWELGKELADKNKYLAEQTAISTQDAINSIT